MEELCAFLTEELWFKLSSIDIFPPRKVSLRRLLFPKDSRTFMARDALLNISEYTFHAHRHSVMSKPAKFFSSQF